MLESTSITKKNANVRLSKILRTWSDVSRSNVLVSPTRSPRSRRKVTVVASIARVTLACGFGLTRMMRPFHSSMMKLRRAASNGTTAAISGVPGTSKIFVGRCQTPRIFVRIGGHPFKILGVWQRPTNIFEVPGTPEIAAVVPFEAARRSFIIDEWNGLIILVKPKPQASVTRAMDATTVTLRRLRGLRVGDTNTFDLLTSDQVLSIFDSLTFAFFFVMLVLSSIALMVGGIGERQAVEDTQDLVRR